MTSYGGGDDGESRAPPEPAPLPVVYDNLVEVHEHAMKLQSVLQGSLPPAATGAGELVKEMMAKLSSAMSVLGTAGGAASPSGAGQGPRRRRKRSSAAAVSSGPHRRSSSRRRTKSPFIKMVTTTKISDDKSWRKYGQKKIQDSTKPRSYYRCTHKPDQGCMATRQVQQSESNPSEFVISYYGKHTCRDLSTLSSLIDQGADAAAAPNCANLISFAPINGAATSTSTSAFPRHSVKETMDQAMLFTRYSSYSLSPAQGGAPSGSASSACYGKFVQHGGGELGDVLGRMKSALTVGSAPAEYWPVLGVTGVDMDAGAAMVDSFPSSPSSLGFGSLGSFGGDDDLFDFDS